MSQEPATLVKVMRLEHWEAVSKALCLAIEHLDSSIQEVETNHLKLGHMKNRLLIEGIARDREIIRSAHLAVLDDKTPSTP